MWEKEYFIVYWYPCISIGDDNMVLRGLKQEQLQVSGIASIPQIPWTTSSNFCIFMQGGSWNYILKLLHISSLYKISMTDQSYL